MEKAFTPELEQYQEIDIQQTLNMRHIHACHALFWCEDYRQNPPTIYALMQMRRDGLFGFPGGKSDEEVIDENEILQTLYRELDEEINFKSSEITMDDHLFSHIGTNSDIVLHFFTKELSLEVFETLERSHMNARDFPKESLGLFRVPLSAVGHQTHEPVLEFFSGLVKQQFAGNAKYQLLNAVIKLNLFGQNDMKNIIKLINSIKISA